MPAPSKSIESARDLIRPGQRFLVTAHAHLDGDALGAMLVSCHGLRAFGKEVFLYNQDPVPQRLRALPGAGEVRRRLPAGARFDATLVHDTGAAHLLGDSFPGPAVTGPLIVLDHHRVASDFGAVLLRDPDAASSGVVAWRLLQALGLSEERMPRELALSLYASLVEDTGWFRYENTNPEALRLAAACVAAGTNPWELARALEQEGTEARLRLLCQVLPGLERHCDGRLALLTLTDDMMRAAGAKPDDVGQLVNYARGLRGVEIGALLTYSDKTIYVSLRGKGAVDVARLAERFGGGGHRNAAGCTLESTEAPERRAAARARLVEAVAEAFREAGLEGAEGR